MTNFDKNNYVVIKNAVEPTICNFAYKYFKNKSKVSKWLWDNKKIETDYWGFFFDDQADGAFSNYSDLVMETLLQSCTNIIEKKINKKLVPNYSYARLYIKGNVLKRHKDRFACEISTTMNLGGDEWAIYIEPDKNIGGYKHEGDYMIYHRGESKGVKIMLKPGDMMVYRGDLCEHWRKKFTGDICGQVFFHYNHEDTEGAKENKYDGRPMLGLARSYCNLEPY
tara:strand:+ start:143 stop:814 length:672 start_codon:yes stop_codon:yes gene_type:complete